MGNTFIVTSATNKQKMLRENVGLHNYRFLSLKELKEKLLEKPTRQALYFLFNKFNLTIPFIINIWQYLPYIDLNQEYKETKLQQLQNIKNALIEAKLYDYDKVFLSALKVAKIQFMDLLESSENIFLLNYLKKEKIPFEVVKVKINPRKINLYLTPDIDSEIYYVFSEITKLLEKGVSPNNIYLINVSNAYYPILKRASYLYKVDIQIPSEASLLDKEEFNTFITNLEEKGLENSLALINDRVLKQALVNIANRYSLKENKDITFLKEIFTYALRKSKYQTKNYEAAIQIGDWETKYSIDDYVFILNFNLDCPHLLKNDYLSNPMRQELGFLSLDAENQIIIEQTKLLLQNIPNVAITKPKIFNGETNFSSVIIENIVEQEVNFELGTSKVLDDLSLASMLDDYSNYGIMTKELKEYDLKHLNYLGYDHHFKSFELPLKEQINLSYSSMKTYFACAFHYYLDYILGLQDNESTLAATLGTYSHKILQDSYKDDFSMSEEQQQEKVNLDSKAKFYASRFDIVLERLLNFNREYEEAMALNEVKREEKIEVKHNFINLKGFIDKIRFLEEGDKLYLAIYDYKTGNDVVSLDNIEYGYNMQLPTYIYLLSHNPKITNKELIFIGFYLQKVTLETLGLQTDLTKPFKLQGFTNSQLSLIKLIDDNYQDSSYIAGLKTKAGEDGLEFRSTAKVFSNDDIKNIIAVVENNLKIIEDSYLNCNFPINPKVIGNKDEACLYCPYANICYKTFTDKIKLEPKPFKKGDNDNGLD